MSRGGNQPQSEFPNFHAGWWNLWQVLAWATTRSPHAVEAAGVEPGYHHLWRIRSTGRLVLGLEKAVKAFDRELASGRLTCETIHNWPIGAGAWAGFEFKLLHPERFGGFVTEGGDAVGYIGTAGYPPLGFLKSGGPEGTALDDLRFKSEVVMSIWQSLNTVRRPKRGNPKPTAIVDAALLKWAQKMWGKDLGQLPGRGKLLELARENFPDLRINQGHVRELRRQAPQEVRKGGAARHQANLH
jgi:hypothetical protein